MCPISWAIPQPKYLPLIYFPFSSVVTGTDVASPGTEPHSIPICDPPAYINAPANILWYLIFSLLVGNLL